VRSAEAGLRSPYAGTNFRSQFTDTIYLYHSRLILLFYIIRVTEMSACRTLKQG